MAEAIKRVVCNTVTEALIRATEEAEDMGHVAIVYEKANGDPGGLFADEKMDLKTLNWLLDQAKDWIWKEARNAE